MIRISVLVEGQTEETFVMQVLRDYFYPLDVLLIPRMLGMPGRKGGIGPYQRAKRDILNTLKQDTTAFCTTMFDYYGMPNNWPKRDIARQKKVYIEKAQVIEQAIASDILSALGGQFNSRRLIPYVQMHEFEALLFSDTQKLAEGLDLTDARQVQRIREGFNTPEEINDNQQTAPSKRLIQLNQDYSKVIDGVLISQSIGLPIMRSECPHFNDWLLRLEKLVTK